MTLYVLNNQNDAAAVDRQELWLPCEKVVMVLAQAEFYIILVS